MSFWEKNLEAIKEHDNDLYIKLEQRLAQIDRNHPDYVVEQARDGSNILGVIRDGRKVMLNSTYRPVDEAEKFVGKIQFTENSITVLVGLGNGQIVSEIRNKINEEATLIIYEPSVDLFYFVMEHFDISDIIADKRVGIFIEGIDEDLFANNLSYIVTNINVGVTVLEAHPKYKELFPDEYEKIKKSYKECRDSALTNLRTMIRRSRLMTENAIANIPYLVRSKIATDLVGKFPEDMPAIIVAGGPSLDKNYEVLKQAKGKALIIAMDRTARFLLDRGIEPDMFCSLDYQKNPSLFEDVRLKDIPFLYMPDLRHQVMNIVNGNKLIYGTGDFQFYNMLIEEYGKQPMDIPVGGSVATFAFGFARAMGFKRTILVGQDLALTGGQVYSGGLKNARAEAEEYDHLMVPGNVEDMVETRGDFYIYLIWFNQAVKDAEKVMEVINATEGGARIEGTKIMTLQEAVDTYCVKEYNVASIFDKETHIFPQDNLKEVYDNLVGKRKELAKLKKVAKDAAEAARRCGVLVERGDTGKEFKDKNKTLSEVGKRFDKDKIASLVNKYVENILLERDMDLYVNEEDQEQEMLRLYRKLEYDYNAVYDNMDGLLGNYDAMLARFRADYGIAEEI